MGEIVELDVTTVEESVTVNVTEEGQVDIAVFAEKGDTGPAGPNSVTSATTSDGTANLSLSNVTTATATVSGTLTANHIHGNIAGSVYAHVRAGEDLAKGDPVYISGSHGSGANLIAIVSKADASDPLKMPAVGVMDAIVTANNNGHMVITGTITDLDTDDYAINATLYVAEGGGWTDVMPSANAQPVAIVERSNQNNGAVIVKVNGILTDSVTSATTSDGTADLSVLYLRAGESVEANVVSANYAYLGAITGLDPSDTPVFPNGIAYTDGLPCYPPVEGGDLITSNTVGAGVATFLETPTSENLAAAVTDETGTGSLVFADEPTINSPTLNNIPEATLAMIATLTGQTGAPPVVLFDDFFGPSSTAVGMWVWQDGTTGTAGTGSTDAGNSPNGASQYAGMCRLSTAAVAGNGRLRWLNIPSSGKMIGLQYRACFAIPDVTNMLVDIGGNGGGGAYMLRYDSDSNSGQWTLRFAVNNVNTIYTFTTETAQAGDFQSGKRYRMSLTRTSGTETYLILEIADYNLANWSDVFRGTITHADHFANLAAWQPTFHVITREAVIKRLCVDWISIYNPNILR